MKKYLMTLAAVLCCGMMTAVFTACSSDDDGDEIVKYKAVGEDGNLFGAQTSSAMNAALSTAFGSDVAYKRDDSKAIKVCDEVAEKVRDVNLIKTINLKVIFPSSDPDAAENSKIIKTYSFPF